MEERIQDLEKNARLPQEFKERMITDEQTKMSGITIREGQRWKLVFCSFGWANPWITHGNKRCFSKTQWSTSPNWLNPISSVSKMGEDSRLRIRLSLEKLVKVGAVMKTTVYYKNKSLLCYMHQQAQALVLRLKMRITVIVMIPFIDIALPNSYSLDRVLKYCRFLELNTTIVYHKRFIQV